MPIDTSLFSSNLSIGTPREIALTQTSEAKAILLSDIASQKREKMLAPVNNALAQVSMDAAYVEADKQIQQNPAAYTTAGATRVPEYLDEAAYRGAKEAVMGVPMTAVGLAAIAGATAETALGKGGMATDLKNAAVDQYVKFQKDMGKDARPEDSLIYSYDQAKQGNLGALVSWATHGTGYVTAQLGTILTGAGIIEKGVELTGKRAVASALGGWVEKEAARLATASRVEVATEAMVKEATAVVTQKIGQQIGIAAVGTGMELGEIGGDKAKQSVVRGTPLTGSEIGRVALATGAASGVEYAQNILSLGALKGKLGAIPGAVDTAAINGITGRAVRTAATAAKVGPAEATQEFVQTGIEQWGKGKNPFDSEQRAEQIESAGMGFLGLVPGAAGASFHGSTSEKEASQLKTDQKRVVEAEAQPGFVDKVQAAVEAKHAEQYMDPESEDFNPVVGVNALKVLNQDEATAPVDKNAHYNTAVNTYNALKEKQLAILDRAEDPKDPMTDEKANVTLDYYSALQAKILPEIQAMGVQGTTSPELKKLLAAANDDATVEAAIAQIFGSRNGGDIGSFMDVDAITNNPVIGADVKSLVQQIKSVEDSKNALTEHATASQKNTGRVTENVFAGTDGQKGINDYIHAIQIATDSKNTTMAQEELDQFADFAQSKQTRATTFRNALNEAMTAEDQRNMDAYNRERKIKKQEPYTVGPAFERTIVAMELEADALSKALTLGSTIAKLTPSSTGEVAPDQAQVIPPTRNVAPSTVVETPGQTISAAPSATTSTMSSTPFAQELVTPGVEGSSSATAQASDNEAPAEAVTAPATEAVKHLEHAEKIQKQFEALPTEALNKVLKDVVKGSRKELLIQHVLDKRRKATAQGGVTVDGEEAGNTQEGRKERLLNKDTPDASASATTVGKPQEQVSAPSGVSLQSGSMNTQVQTKTEVSSAKENPNVKTDKTNPAAPVAKTNEVNQAATDGNKTDESGIPEKADDVAVPISSQVTLTTPQGEGDTNKIRTTFKPERNKSYFHQAVDFLKNAVADAQDAETETDPDRVTLITDILAFTEEFTAAAKANFKYKKNEAFHFEDPLNWLADQGVLPDVVNTAVSATVYKWLATRAAETEINDEDDARGILGLGSDAELLKVTIGLVSGVGTSSTALSEGLGKEILKVIGIKAGDLAQAQAQERVEIALGFTALATMQKLGYIERINVSSAALAKLIAANKKFDLDFRMTPEEFRAKSQETDAKFFKIIPSERTKEIKQAYSKSKTTWDTLFTGEKSKTDYSWEAFPHDATDQEEMRGSSQKASVKRTKQKNRNEDRPIQLATRTVNLFNALNQETQDVILGKESLDGLHRDQVQGVTSANRGLETTWNQVQDWLHNAGKQPAGAKSLFRIPAWFGANTRMYQEGSVNMQGSKPQRYMLSMQDWEGTFDLLDQEMVDLFLEAVGQSLKIESSKDLNFLDSTREALATPVMVEALAAIEQVLKQIPDIDTLDQEATAEIAGTLDPKLMTAIAKGVQESKQNVHTFKGLLEYQRFVNAVNAGDKTFTTDISFGQDGMANGSAIASVQLTLSEMTPQQLGIYLSEGISFTDEVTTGDHAATYDPYQAIGGVWGNELAQIEADLEKIVRSGGAQHSRNAAIKNLYRIKAAKSLLGPLYGEDGLLAGITRKLAKDRSVPALYGAGKKSLILGLLNNAFIDKAITKKLQALAASDSVLAQQEFKDFRDNVNLVASTENWGSGVIRPDGSLNKKALLSLEVTADMAKGLQAYIEAYHGKALQTAIETIYGDIQAASKPLNQAIAIGVGYHNTALELLIADHLKTHDEITVGDLKAIKEKLQPLFPKIRTPHGDYIEVAEYENSKDYDKSNPLNIEQYYLDPKISRLTGRPHNIGKLANPGVKPVVTATHMIDAAVAVEVIGNEIGAGVLNAHDNFIVGLHRVKEINELSNSSFHRINSEYSMAEALQISLQETKAAFKALGFDKMPEARKILDANFAELKLSVKITGASGQTVTSTDTVDIVRENKKMVTNVVAVTKKNKALILGAATRVNQYYVAGGGYKTGNKQQENIGNIPVKDIVPLAQIGVKTLAASNVKLTNIVKATLAEVEKELIGSRLDPMSDNPADYAIQQTIDGQNVVDTYDALKQNSMVIDTPGHDAHLKGILNTLVANVMNPVEIFLKTTTADETHGQLDTENARVFIASQVASPTPVSGALANGIRMSTGEVYVHELVHAVTHTGLRANKYLQHQVEVLYKIAARSLDFRAFLNDPTVDVDDQANHYDVQAAKDRFDYVFRGKSVTKRAYADPVTKMHYTEELSNHLDEFIALGLTNANFAKALARVSLAKHKQQLTAGSTWAGIIGKNLQETIVNIFGKLLEILHEKFDKGISANNVGAELQRLAKLLTKIDSKNKTQLYNLVQKGMLRYSKFAGMANHQIKEIFKKAPVLRTIHHFKVGMQVARESKTLLGDAIRKVEYRYNNLDQGLIKSIVTEMKGHTPRMDWVHRLLHRRKNYLDHEKTAIIATVKKEAGGLFHREMISEEKVTVYKAGMKTGLSDLLAHMDMTKIASLVSSKTAQQKEIDSIIKEIQVNPVLAPYAVYYNQSADALGYHMVHGCPREGEHTFLNAKVIGHLLNSTQHQGKLTQEQGEAATVLVDKLATLYALKHTSAQHLKTLSDLIAEDSEGIAQILRLHNELKQDSLKYAFDEDAFQFIKGYTKEILNPRVDYKLGTLADEKEMAELGYTRSERPIERDPSDPTRHTDVYAYTADTNRVNDYNSQVFSLSNNKPKGADTYRLAQQQDESTKAGANNNRLIMQAKQRELDAMFFPYAAPLKPGGNPMVAQVDDKGMITKYRYMMSESTKDGYLEKMNEFDTVMGAMAGQVIDKARSPVINEELIDGLKAMYDGEYSNNPGAYVEVSPYSADPKLREIYYMMPAKARQYVDQQWGSSRMFVAKDVLTIAFGYRKYSVVQAFAKTPAERHALEKVVVGLANFVFRSHGLTVANNTELVMMALTKMAKNNIVVKALTLTLENFGSNVMHLKARGVTMQQILTQGFEALQQGLKYQEDKQKLDQLELRQKLITDRTQIKENELKIIMLKDAIGRNPVTRFIEAGGLPSLVDDFETDVTQDNFPSKTEKFLESVTDKLPQPLVNIGKVLFLTQDTGAYKLMNNAVKMTDFVARYVLYQHYMKEATQEPGFDPRDKAMVDEAHSKAVIRVMEEFVNFDLPTHKTIEYLNSVGLVWFSKYTLRIQKTIISTIADRPFDAIASLVMASAFGLDHIDSSLLGVGRDTLKNFGNPVSTFTDTSEDIFTMSSMKALFNM